MHSSPRWDRKKDHVLRTSWILLWNTPTYMIRLKKRNAKAWWCWIPQNPGVFHNHTIWIRFPTCDWVGTACPTLCQYDSSLNQKFSGYISEAWIVDGHEGKESGNMYSTLAVRGEMERLNMVKRLNLQKGNRILLLDCAFCVTNPFPILRLSSRSTFCLIIMWREDVLSSHSSKCIFPKLCALRGLYKHSHCEYHGLCVRDSILMGSLGAQMFFLLMPRFMLRTSMPSAKRSDTKVGYLWVPVFLLRWCKPWCTRLDVWTWFRWPVIDAHGTHAETQLNRSDTIPNTYAQTCLLR